MSDKNEIEIHSALEAAAARFAGASLSKLMRAPNRDNFIFSFEDLQADCTRQPMDSEVMSLLIALAQKRGLKARLEEMFSGAAVNLTEGRPVVHCDLRNPERGQSDEYRRLCAYAERVRGTGDITAIVNLGIGGSDLGPAMVAGALAGYHDGPECYYVGNICPSYLHDVLAKCEPGKTLFIVTSKTFTTAETLANAGLAKSWLEDNGVAPGTAMAAVTAYDMRARDWGIPDAQIFSFAEGVGGRYRYGLRLACQ